MLSELNDRYKEILRHVVDHYLQYGEPAGSSVIASNISEKLSTATIRNVMADLEELGLLYAPHISAGRMPTQSGLRLFVDGLMEVQPLHKNDRKAFETLAGEGKAQNDVYEQASGLLSAMSNCAAVIAAPKKDKTLRQIEFVQLAPGRVLIVLVSEDGMIENRLMDVPADIPASSLTMASNYLNSVVLGRQLKDVRSQVQEDIEDKQQQLDAKTAQLIKLGLAQADLNSAGQDGILVVRGQGHLLDSQVIADLEHVRQLFDALENRKTMLKLLETIGDADGMQIFIGSENKAFKHAGISMVVSPYKDKQQQIIGAIGVIGPTRLNYGRIVPMVDYTSQILSRLIG
jgi:heat-inducible transcriptional repressor